MNPAYQRLCKESMTVLSFPLWNGGTYEYKELLRLRPGGEVLFNYADWSVNTATDVFFREIAKQAPELCQTVAADVYADLSARVDKETKAHVACEVQRVKAEKENDMLASTNEALAQKPDPIIPGFFGAIGGLIAGLLVALIFVNLRRTLA